MRLREGRGELSSSLCTSGAIHHDIADRYKESKQEHKGNKCSLNKSRLDARISEALM